MPNLYSSPACLVAGRKLSPLAPNIWIGTANIKNKCYLNYDIFNSTCYRFPPLKADFKVFITFSRKEIHENKDELYNKLLSFSLTKGSAMIFVLPTNVMDNP